MENLYNRIKRGVFREKRCPACKRTITQAIEDQVNEQEACPLGHCRFKKEINEALRLSKKPELIEFQVNTRNIFAGYYVTVSWEVKNTKRVSINGFNEVNQKGTQNLQLTKNTRIQLEFESFAGKIHLSKPIDVKVYPLPEIKKFEAGKTRIIRGTPVKIQWKTKAASHTFLSINGREEQVGSNDFIEIHPQQDVTIALRVRGSLNKEIRSEARIRVHEPAQILSFSTNKNKVIGNQPITFTHQVKNASKIYISDASGENKADVTRKKQYIFKPGLPNDQPLKQTFFLEVYDQLNNPLPKFPISLEVFPEPKILSFNISRKKILAGGKAQISWEAKNFSSVFLKMDEKYIDVTNRSAYYVEPKKTTRYKIVVTGLADEITIDSEHQQLEVYKPVEIEFYPDQQCIVQTTAARLHWRVQNATSIRLDPGNQQVETTGNMLIYPNQTITYEIHASNAMHHQRAIVRINVFPVPHISKVKLPELPDLTPHLEHAFIQSSEYIEENHAISIAPPEDLQDENQSQLLEFLNQCLIHQSKSLVEHLFKNLSFSEEISNLKKRIDHG